MLRSNPVNPPEIATGTTIFVGPRNFSKIYAILLRKESTLSLEEMFPLCLSVSQVCVSKHVYVYIYDIYESYMIYMSHIYMYIIHTNIITYIYTYIYIMYISIHTSIITYIYIYIHIFSHLHIMWPEKT